VQNVPSVDAFKVARTASAASPIDITDNGFGVHYVYVDPSLYWTQLETIP